METVAWSRLACGDGTGDRQSFAEQNHRDEAKRSRDDHFSRGIIGNLYEVLKAPDIGSGRLRGVRKSPESWRLSYSSIAQSVEHAAVNRAVVGSSPTRGVFSLWELRNLRESRSSPREKRK